MSTSRESTRIFKESLFWRQGMYLGGGDLFCFWFLVYLWEKEMGGRINLWLQFRWCFWTERLGTASVRQGKSAWYYYNTWASFCVYVLI